MDRLGVKADPMRGFSQFLGDFALEAGRLTSRRAER
jgi:hypothetical protein